MEDTNEDEKERPFFRRNEGFNAEGGMEIEEKPFVEMKMRVDIMMKGEWRRRE